MKCSSVWQDEVYFPFIFFNDHCHYYSSPLTAFFQWFRIVGWVNLVTPCLKVLSFYLSMESELGISQLSHVRCSCKFIFLATWGTWMSRAGYDAIAEMSNFYPLALANPGLWMNAFGDHCPENSAGGENPSRRARKIKQPPPFPLKSTSLLVQVVVMGDPCYKVEMRLPNAGVV